MKVSAVATGKPLNHYWSVGVGAGRANEGLRAGWLEHLRVAADECDFRYVRFHGLFHDDMFVYREVEGKPVYNFQYIDALFDAMLELGVRPFVELGFCPRDLASETETVMWWKGHGSPPKSMDGWSALVTAFVRHCLERYGREEVLDWYFEVWNEPNLSPFFSGTKSQYFELYRASATAIKAVDPALRVGGPATSNFVPDGRFDGETEDVSRQVLHTVDDLDTLVWKPVWVEDFLAFCAREGLPVDFVSTHPYPTDFALDGHGVCRGKSRSVGSTQHDLQWLRRAVEESPFPNAEIHLTEWSSSPSSRDHSHDALPAAAYIVKTNLDARGLADSLSYWTFTDVFEEAGAGDSIFHGGFGLINFQGIVKPAFHAYRLLAGLGDEELAATDGLFVSRHSDSGAISVLAYNYPAAYPQSVGMTATAAEAAAIQAIGDPITVELTLTDLAPGATFLIETLDGDHGAALAAWQAMGSPEPPTRAQTFLLQDAAWATRKELVRADANGVLALTQTLLPWSVVGITEVR